MVALWPNLAQDDALVQSPHDPLRAPPGALLTVAGSDPSGAAGAQVDLQVFRALGFHGLSALTAITWQDTCTVHGWQLVTPEALAAQLDVILADIHPAAIKIGVLPSAAHVEVLAERLPEAIPVVHDPVFESGDGRRALVEQGALEAMRALLWPRVDLLTPNLPEALAITGRRDGGAAQLTELASLTREQSGARAVLLKTGHAIKDSAEDTLCDHLADARGVHCLKPLERLDLGPLGARGTGCQLASAAAAHLALGCSTVEACELARAFLWHKLRHDLYALGRGRGVVGYF